MIPSKKFIIDTLLPYKVYPTTCAIQYDACLYLTSDGRKCAIGKHMKPGPWQKERCTVATLAKKYNLKEILTGEAAEVDLPILSLMQDYHDSLNNKHNESSLNAVRKLEELTKYNLSELK